MEHPAGVVLRSVVPGDAASIARLYAHYVLTHTSTFEIEPPDAAQMQSRIAALLAAGFPYLVACDDDRLLGFCYLGPYRARVAYRHTAEDSVYVGPTACGRGIGTRLLRECLALAPAAGIREVVAVIGDTANTASVALHRQCGFRHIGTLQNVGYKFERWIDTVFMQLSLPGHPAP